MDNEDLFMIGQYGQQTVAYMFDQTKQNWTSLMYTFAFGHCGQVNKLSMFSCSYVRQENSIVTLVENCFAIFNITSNEWTYDTINYTQGVIFDNDEKDFFYIGSHNLLQESHLYMVKFHIWLKEFF